MCHINQLSLLADDLAPSPYPGAVSALRYGGEAASRRIALLPDIFGVTPSCKGLACFLSHRGARVYLVNPWEPFGELAEPTREAAWERRHRIRDRSFCDSAGSFLMQERIETVVGFCIGGNFLLEMVRRGYTGCCCAFYPLPWGMPNPEGLQPPFEYMVDLEHEVTILAGEADHLAGPENTRRLRDICRRNPKLDLHLYASSGHGFLADLDSDDRMLRANARAALEILLERVFRRSEASTATRRSALAGATDQ